MQSDRQPANSIEQSTNRLADIVGTLIALLTLILPLTMISYYSGSTEFSQAPDDKLSKSK